MNKEDRQWVREAIIEIVPRLAEREVSKHVDSGHDLEVFDCPHCKTETIGHREPSHPQAASTTSVFAGYYYPATHDSTIGQRRLTCMTCHKKFVFTNCWKELL